MALKFNGRWRFQPPPDGLFTNERIPDAAVAEFYTAIGRVATQGERQAALEHLKSYFGDAAGTSTSWSSTVSWAEHDLRTLMEDAAKNAPLFIEAIYEGCESFAKLGVDYFAPDAATINGILERFQIGYAVVPPDLVARENAPSARPPHGGGASSTLPARVTPTTVFVPPHVDATPERRYDVAISFAGEDRAHAETIAKGLSGAGITVFYDYYEISELWGKDLFQYLHSVYSDSAHFAIILVSKNYIAPTKLWPKHELKASQSRQFTSDVEYILPIRLDDATVPGLPETTGYLDFRTTTMPLIVEAVRSN